jgi:hypothetical protein
MPITYKHVPETGVLEIVASGDIGLAEVASCLTAVRGEPWFPAPAIADVRGVTPSIPSHEVREVAGLLRAMAPQLKSVPVAIVVSSTVLFGLVRMLELMLDDVISIKPFHDFESARDWLANPHAAG